MKLIQVKELKSWKRVEASERIRVRSSSYLSSCRVCLLGFILRNHLKRLFFFSFSFLFPCGLRYLIKRNSVCLFSPENTPPSTKWEGTSGIIKREEGARILGVRMRSKMRELYIRFGGGGVARYVRSLCGIHYLKVKSYITILLEEKIIPKA